MKRSLLVVGCVCMLAVASSALAEGFSRGERPNKSGQGGALREKGMAGHDGPERPLMKLITNPEMVEKIGLSEAQVDAIKEKLFSIEVREIDLEADLKKSALEQAKLMTAETIDKEAVMKAVEKTGEIKTELAKLRIESMLFIRETLTAEQVEKVRDLTGKQREQERKMRMKQLQRDRESEGMMRAEQRMRDRKMRREARANEEPGEDNCPAEME